MDSVPRRRSAAVFALVPALCLGCATVRLPAPPVPPAGPRTAALRSAPVRPDTVLIEATDGPARVDVVRASRVDPPLPDAQSAQSTGVLHTRLLCVAPCAAELPAGVHLLRFTLRDLDAHERRFGALTEQADATLNPSTRVATVVSVDTTRGPRRVTVSLGRHVDRHDAQQAGGVLLAMGAAFLAVVPVIAATSGSSAGGPITGLVVESLFGAGGVIAGAVMIARPTEVQPASVRLEDLRPEDLARPW